MDITDYMIVILNSDYFVIVIRTILAIISGGVIGIERVRSNQPAGMRTYMLVCLGSALVMMTSDYMYSQFQNGDPARLGAQVINGIGFLGAGSIIISGNTKIKGLTTAAGLWVSACIGIAIGIGFYFGGIIVTIAVYVIMSKFRKLEDKLAHNNSTIKLYVVFEEVSNISEFKSIIEVFGIEIINFQVNSKEEDEFCNAVIEMKKSNQIKEEDIVLYLKRMEGIKEINITS